MKITHTQENINKPKESKIYHKRDKKAKDEFSRKDKYSPWFEKWLNSRIRLRAVERVELIDNLNMILQAGVPVVEAFEMLLLETKKKNIRKILTTVCERIKQGIPLSESLSLYPKLFSPSFIGSIKVGEMSGDLMKVMEALAEKEKRDMELRSKLIGILAYPIVVLTSVFVVGGLMMVFVVPKIVSLFHGSNVVLPLQTRIIITVSDFLVLYFKEIGIGLIISIILLYTLSFFKPVKRIYNFITLHSPLFGKLIRQTTLTRIGLHLHSLLKSGIPIVETIELTSSTMKNVYYKESLNMIARSLEQGQAISEGIKKYPNIYPPLMARMMSVGERTGNLAETSLKISEFYRKRLQAQLNILTSVLSPIILIIIGSMVGLVALAIISPIYQFMGTI